MREFVKSAFSFPLAMTLFGVKQAVDMLTPRHPTQTAERTAAALNGVTEVAESRLDGALREAFRAGDRFQRGVVDAMFDGSGKAVEMASKAVQQSADAVRRAAPGGASGSPE